MSCVFGTELYYVIQGVLRYFVVKITVSLEIHVRDDDIRLAWKSGAQRDRGFELKTTEKVRVWSGPSCSKHG